MIFYHAGVAYRLCPASSIRQKPERGVFSRKNPVALGVASIWHWFKAVFITSIKISIKLASVHRPNFSVSSGLICSAQHWCKIFCNSSFFCRKLILFSVLHGPMFVFNLVVITPLWQMVQATLPLLQIRRTAQMTLLSSCYWHLLITRVHWCWLRMPTSRIGKNRMRGF